MNPKRRLMLALFAARFLLEPSIGYSAFEPAWSYTHAATGNDSAWGVVGPVSFDLTGNVVVGGAFVFASNTRTGLVFKLNTTGQLQWATALGDFGTQGPTKLLINDTGVAWIVGPNDSFGTGYDYWTAKLSPDGALNWTARYHNSNASSNLFNGDRPADVAVDAAGDVYVTGQSYAGGSGTPFDFATVKYAGGNGVQQWIDRYDSQISPSYDRAINVLAGPGDNITVVGIGSKGFYHDEIVLIMYDSSGARRRLTRFDQEINNGMASRLDGAGNVIVACGNYLLKFDALARLLWIKPHAAGAFPSLDIDASGRILVSGTGGGILVGAFSSEGDELWISRAEGTSWGAWWQADGSVLATGAGANSSGDFGAVGLGFDSQGNLTDYVWDGSAYPRAGVASRAGQIVFAGEGPAILVSEYRRTSVIGQPRIIQQPAPVTVIKSNNATFTVVAEGPGPLRYQWRSYGAAVEGATNSVYVLSNVTEHANGARISVEVWNDLGRTRSPEAKITVLVPPGPGASSSFIAVAGESVTLSADAWYATQPVTNQWFFEEERLPTLTNYLVIPNFQTSQAGVYRAEVGNVAGSSTQEWRIAVSTPMPITWVTPPADVASNAALDLDAQGNAFVTSSTSQNGRAYVLTAKYSPNGAREWSQTFGGTSVSAFGDAIKRDGTGHLYVAGRPTASSVCLLKYDENGMPLWTNLLSIVPESIDAHSKLALAEDGGCYLGITARNPANSLVIALARVAPSGINLWQTSITTNISAGGVLGGFAALPDGNLAVVGSLAGNGLVMVIDENGNIAWQDLVEIGDPGYASCVAADRTGGFVAAGNSSVLFENQIFLGKYSTGGTRVWFHKYPKGAFGSSASGLAVDSNQNVVLASRWTTLKVTRDGVSVWTNSFAPGMNFNGIMQLDAADNIHYVGVGFDLGYYFDYAAVKFDSTGRLLALSRYRQNALNSFHPTSYAVHDDGSIYVAGILGGRLSVVKHGRQSILTRLSLTPPNQMGMSTLRVTGEPGFSYTIESSELFDSWEALTNTANLSGTVQFEHRTDDRSRRFFRAAKNP